MNSREYFAYISCDTGLFYPLEGKYSILKYTLEPCKNWERNQHRGVSNFTIGFPFNGLPEKDPTNSEEDQNYFKNHQTAIDEALLFVAWLSVATRKSLRLSHVDFGDVQNFGPSSHEPIEEINRDLMVKAHRIIENAVEGTYEKVERPMYESYIDSEHSLRIPHDFPSLSKKLFSLPSEKREMFFDSCLSYQFALLNMGTIPSVSLVALVNVVESLMREEKKSVMKKFRKFFEDNLQDPLPIEKRKFLDAVYSSRSNFVHKALLGSGPFRGPIYMGIGRGRELKDQLSEFKALVNACMINWLIRL